MRRLIRSCGVLLSGVLLIVLSLCTLITTAYATETLTYRAIDSFTIPAGIDVIETVNADGTFYYPWTVQEDGSLKSGNSFVDTNKSVSALKVTVTGYGVLCFEYKVSAPDKISSGADPVNHAESTPDSLYISVGKDITINYPGRTVPAGIQRYYGETDWQTGTVVVDAEDGQVTDIYIAYKKNANTTHGISDCAWIKNLTFSDARVTVTAVSTDETCGTVSGGGKYNAGDEVTLTAEPTETGRFYGWQRDGKLVGRLNTYTFTAAGDSTVTALFGDPTVIVAQSRTTGELYSDLNTALETAKAGETVIQHADVTLSTDTEIRAGVTLYVSYSDIYNAQGYTAGTTSNSTILATEEQTYCRLTVAENTTLTVKGSLLVGGVIGYPGQSSYQGHTSGAHGRVTNNGTILITSGGLLDTWGFVDGSGTVTVRPGGYVKEPFIVFDFAGGSNTVNGYDAGQSPFVQYTMQNIRCPLEINAGARLVGHCNLHASSNYNRIDCLIIGGPADQEALLLLSEGATLTRTVDMSKTIENSGRGADIGRVTYHINGGAAFGGLKMQILVEVSTYATDFPIPYCYRYELGDGVYTIPYSLKLMPGAEMHVASGAELKVGPDGSANSSGKLYVLDGLDQLGMSAPCYPTTAMLYEAGFPQNGSLVVDGKLTIADSGHFGGIVQTNGTGRIVTGANVSLSDTIQSGYYGAYADNTVITALPARIYDAKTDSLIQLTANKVYTGSTASNTLESYTQLLKAVKGTEADVTDHSDWVKYDKYETPDITPMAADYSMIGSVYYIYDKSAAPVAYASPQTIVGAFASTSDQYAVTVTNKTHYDAADATRAVIEDAVLTAQNTISFTVTPSAGYVSLVQYKLGAGGTLTTLTKGGDGRYLIESVSDDVTIVVTSVLKGDVKTDGVVDNKDLILIRKKLAGTVVFDEIQLLVADLKSDDFVDNKDLMMLRKFLSKNISEL